MLPDDIYDHYYDRPCEFCREQIDIDDQTDCDVCDKLVCEDCRESTECHICMAKLEEDEDIDIPIVCPECMNSCDACVGVSFHSACKAEHKKTCSTLGRAQRDVASITSAVDAKTREVGRAQRELAQLEDKLKGAISAAKSAQVQVDKKRRREANEQSTSPTARTP
jgi:hypothetical protein